MTALEICGKRPDDLFTPQIPPKLIESLVHVPDSEPAAPNASEKYLSTISNLGEQRISLYRGCT